MDKKNRHNRFKEFLDVEDKPHLLSDSYLNEKGEEDWHGLEFHGSVPGTETDFFLPKGLKILRYGDEGGRYAAPIGTPYAMLAMPYQIRSLEYNEYEVVADNVIQVIPVKEGIVAQQPSWPEERGGGIQYYFPDIEEQRRNVLHYVDRGLRRLEEKEWSPIIEEDFNHK